MPAPAREVAVPPAAPPAALPAERPGSPPEAVRPLALGSGYRLLKAWQRAMEAAAQVHALVDAMPEEARGRIGAELWRTAIAVPAQIAAGTDGYDRADYYRTLGVAKGAIARLETLLLLAGDLALLPAAAVERLLVVTGETRRLVRALARPVSVPATPVEASTIQPPSDGEEVARPRRGTRAVSAPISTRPARSRRGAGPH